MPQSSVLSSRQERILAMIREFTAEFGYPPTIRQIGKAVDISSTSVVSYNLNILQRKGLLTRASEISRGLRLMDDDGLLEEVSEFRGQPPVSVPLVGFIAAGEPIPIPDSDFSQTDVEQITIPQDLAHNAEDTYALQVRGTSMIDALIADGDIVIMRYQVTAQNGDMVAAWLKDEKATTLKRYYWEKGHNLVRLQPANPLMEPIFVHPANLEIQGKVIGVIRRL